MGCLEWFAVIPAYTASAGKLFNELSCCFWAVGRALVLAGLHRCEVSTGVSGSLGCFWSSPPPDLLHAAEVGRGSWKRGIWGRQFEITCDLCSCVVFQEAHEVLDASNHYWQ